MSGELRGRRVLFLFSTLSFGGAERQGLLVAEHLLAAGAQVSVWGLAPARDGQLDARCRALGIRPRHVHCPQPQLEARRLAGLARFALLLRAARPDVLLPATHIPNLVASLSWRAGGARLCVWNQRDEGIGLDGSRLQRFAARRCPLFVSNTARGAEVLSERLGVDPRRVRYLPNGVALPAPRRDRAAWRAELGVAPAQPLACMLASYSVHKDHETLLRAWPRVREAAPGATLILAGKRGGTRGRLERLARELELGEAVRFRDSTPDVAGLLGAVDLLVHSSVAEGQPNAVLEGMASGLPVVASSAGAAVALDDPAQQVPVGDVRAWAERVAALLRDPAERARLGERNRERVEREFSRARMVARWSELLREHLR